MRGLGQSGDLATAIALAIQRQEGICSSDVCRNNNPGALMNPSTGTMASYPDYQSGFNALVNQVQLNINRGLNLQQFFGGVPGGYPGYAPAAAGNDPTVYASNVASWVGIDSTTPLNQISYSGGGSTPSAGSGLVADVSGAAASTPTADILSSIGDGTDPLASLFSSTGIDLTDPTTLLIGAVLVGGLVYAVVG